MSGKNEQVNQYWKLFDETAALLNRTSIKSHFEKQLTTIAIRFQSAPSNISNLKELHLALIELRKKMRILGYDLSMGKYSLIFDGFRNDEVYGFFTRIVLAIGQNGVFYWKTGDGNHLTLDGFLENTIMKIKVEKKINMGTFEKHYLWFKKTISTVTLSGSATETAESYEKLKKYAEADNLLFLSRLKGLI